MPAANACRGDPEAEHFSGSIVPLSHSIAAQMVRDVASDRQLKGDLGLCPVWMCATAWECQARLSS